MRAWRGAEPWHRPVPPPQRTPLGACSEPQDASQWSMKMSTCTRRSHAARGRQTALFSVYGNSMINLKRKGIFISLPWRPGSFSMLVSQVRAHSPGALVRKQWLLPIYASIPNVRQEIKIKRREITPTMFSLTWGKQQTSRWPALGQNNCKDCSTIFPSQSCLRSFVLPSGISLPVISSDVWRYFGISPLSLEIFQSTSLEWLLWSAAFASATEISHPVQLPQVPCSTLNGRQQSTVRLILND